MPCGWLANDRFGAEWKPERSKIVITADKIEGALIQGTARNPPRFQGERFNEAEGWNG